MVMVNEVLAKPKPRAFKNGKTRSKQAMNKQIVLAHLAAVIADIRANLGESGPWLNLEMAHLRQLLERYEEIRDGDAPWPDEVEEAKRWASSQA